MNSKLLMIQGTSSGAGKKYDRYRLMQDLTKRGFKVAPFKSQNMSSFIHKIKGTDKIIARAQAIQSLACKTYPDPSMNPILLEPQGNYESNVYVNGRFFSKMKAHQYYSDFVLQRGFNVALNAFKELQKNHDIILLEGAGSPAEINIQKYDISNMLFAKKVNSPVIVVSDIERGGCFASILGTLMLLKPIHQDIVKGFMINKFRGDPKILIPAIRKIQNKTKKPILGIIPKIDHNIPQEDSLDGDDDTENNKKPLPRIKLNKIVKKGSPTDPSLDLSSFNQSKLDQEIDRFAVSLETSINFKYIMDRIIK